MRDIGYWYVDPKAPHMIMSSTWKVIDEKSIKVTKDVINASLPGLSEEEVYANARRIARCINALYDITDDQIDNGDLEQWIENGMYYE